MSSLCTISITPMVRVESPQLFCQANSFCAVPSFASPLLAVRSAAVSNSMPNILEKFWPRQWLVPPCKAQLASGFARAAQM